MGKGLNKRHRLKKVEESKYNNLPKAALGKASPFPKLPDAPKPEDLVDHVPRSLRKFMTLKDAADKERLRKAALKERHAAQAALTSDPAAPVAPQAPPAGPHQQAVEQAGALASSGGVVPADTPRVYKTSAFEQVVKKTLKPRKKEAARARVPP
ncbi:hypothetical protein HaLaN_18745 [Haematococcus lacustris]|uniref:Uncharacterized protein n=1 Tax=Haematococcus lacustris TaxID=44745 RepID=A0A699ZSX5_HAELA|nr:hypothetical protein HaLaN_18745 [Haematococcus lacustris]